MRARGTGPKRNVWKDPSPYGTYEGPRGSEDQWSDAFNEAWDMGHGEAVKVMADKSPWGILGVSEDCTLAEVKAAFCKMVMLHHPDRGGDPEKCREVIAAWNILKGRMA